MEQSNELELTPADFSARVVAFSIDVALFGALYLLSFWLAFPGYPIISYAAAPYWHFPWIAAFLLYQAYFSAEGRASLGKKVLGLRVVDRDGQPLPLDQALLRASVYLVSSVGGLGFAWALFNRSGQAWHDLPVGSVVVRDGRGENPVVRMAAMGCLSLLALGLYWQTGWGDRYHELRDLADAQVGFHEISTLQSLYHDAHGRYTDNLWDLAPISGDPAGFLRDMANLYDLNSGFAMSSTKDGKLVIRAVAQDHVRTPLTFVGS